MARVLAGGMALGALAGGTTGCETEPEVPFDGLLQLEPAAIDFGEVSLGTVEHATAWLIYAGPPGAQLTEPSVPGDPRLSVRLPDEKSLASGARLRVELRLDAAVEGPLRAEVELGLRSGHRVRLTVSGTVVSSPAAARTLDLVAVYGTSDRAQAHFPGATLADLRWSAAEGIAPCSVDADAAFCAEAWAVDDGVVVEARYSPRSKSARDIATLGVGTDGWLRLEGRGLPYGLSCPTELTFPSVAAGTCAEAKLICRNEGNQRVELLGASFEGSRAFGRGEGPQPMGADPEARIVFPLRYCAGTQAMDEGDFLIEANQPSPGDRLRTRLRTGPAGSQLSVAPTSLELGTLAVGEPARAWLELASLGVEPVQVYEVVSDVAQVAPVGRLELPVGATVTLPLQVSLPEAGEVRGTLSVYSSDPNSPHLIPLHAIGEALEPCSVTAEATSELGTLEVGRPSLARVSVQSTGSTVCLLNRIDGIPGRAPGLRLPRVELPRRLEPGERFTTWVEVRPEASGAYVTALEAQVPASGAGGNIELELRGDAQTSVPWVAPSGLDFGVSGAECGAFVRSLRVWAPIGEEALVTELEVEGAAFTLLDPPDLSTSSWRLDASTALELRLRWVPTSTEQDEGTVVIHTVTATEQQTLRVPVAGRSAGAPSRTERFVQAEARASDVLYVLDFSTGTESLRRALGAALEDTTRVAREAGIDARIGVVGGGLDGASAARLLHPGGDGPFAGPFDRRTFAATATDAHALMAARVDALGVGLGAAVPLDTALKALSAPMRLGPNQGMLRPGAHFGLVTATLASDGSGSSELRYADHLDVLSGLEGRRGWTAVAVAGPAPEGCSGRRSADAAPRLEKLVELSDGTFVSACAVPLAAAMRAAGESVAGLKAQFPLAQTPVPGSLEVWVDGRPVDAERPDAPGFRVLSQPLAVELPSAPAAGAVVELRYVPACGN